MPTDLGRWRVLLGNRPTASFRSEIAGVARDDLGLARAASRFGLCSSGPSIRAERAVRLVGSIRQGLTRDEEAPLRDPLIVYAAGQDPRPMWKTHVPPDFFQRDLADEIADAIVSCLRVLAQDADFSEWDRRSAEIAKAWVPGDGVARLHRLAVASVRRKPSLAPSAWIPVFAKVLLRCRRRIVHRLRSANPTATAEAEGAKTCKSAAR